MSRGSAHIDRLPRHCKSHRRCPTRTHSAARISTATAAVTAAGLFTLLILVAVIALRMVLAPQRSGSRGTHIVAHAEATSTISESECSGGYIIMSSHTFRVPWGDTEATRFNITIDGCTTEKDLNFAPAVGAPISAALGVWIVISDVVIVGVDGQIRFDQSLVLGEGSGVIISGITFPDALSPFVIRRLQLSGQFWDGARLFVTGFQQTASLGVASLSFRNFSTGEIRGIYLTALSAVPTLELSSLTVFDGSTFALIGSIIFATGGNDAISLGNTIINNGGTIVFDSVTTSGTAGAAALRVTDADITVTEGYIAAAFTPSAGPSAQPLRKSTLRIVNCRFRQTGTTTTLVPAIQITPKPSKGIDGSLIHISGTTVEAFRQALYINTTAGPANLPQSPAEPARDRVSPSERKFFFYGPDTTINDLLSDRNGNAAAHVVVEGCFFSSSSHNAIEPTMQTVTVYFGDHVVFYYDSSNSVNGETGNSGGGVFVRFTRPSNYSHVSIVRSNAPAIIAAVYLEWSPQPPPFDASGPEWTPNNNTFVRVYANAKSSNPAPLNINLSEANGASISIENFLGYISQIRWGKCTDCFISIRQFVIVGNVGNQYPDARLLLGATNWHVAPRLVGAGAGIEVNNLLSYSDGPHSLQILGDLMNVGRGVVVSGASMNNGGVYIGVRCNGTTLRIERSQFRAASGVRGAICIVPEYANPHEQYWWVGAPSSVIIEGCTILMRVNTSAIEFRVMPGAEGAYIIIKDTTIQPDSGGGSTVGAGGVVFLYAIRKGTFVFLSGNTFVSPYASTVFLTFASPPVPQWPGEWGIVLHDHLNVYHGAGHLRLPLYGAAHTTNSAVAAAAVAGPTALSTFTIRVPRAVNEAICKSVQRIPTALLHADLSEPFPHDSSSLSHPSTTSTCGASGAHSYSSSPWRLLHAGDGNSSKHHTSGGGGSLGEGMEERDPNGPPLLESPAARMRRVYEESLGHCRLAGGGGGPDIVTIPASDLIFIEGIGGENAPGNNGDLINVTIATRRAEGTSGTGARPLRPIVAVRNSTLSSLRVSIGSAVNAVVLLFDLNITGLVATNRGLALPPSPSPALLPTDTLGYAPAAPLLRIVWGSAPTGNDTLIAVHNVTTAGGRSYGGAELYGVAADADLGGGGGGEGGGSPSWSRSCYSSAGEPAPTGRAVFSGRPLIALLRCDFGGRVGLMASASHFVGCQAGTEFLDFFSSSRSMHLSGAPIVAFRHCTIAGGLGLGGAAGPRAAIVIANNTLLCAPSADYQLGKEMPPGASGPHGTAFSPCLHIGTHIPENYANYNSYNKNNDTNSNGTSCTNASSAEVFIASTALVIANNTVLISHLDVGGDGAACGPEADPGAEGGLGGEGAPFGRFCGVGFSADVPAGAVLIVDSNAVAATPPISNRTAAFRLFRSTDADAFSSSPPTAVGAYAYGSRGGLILPDALAILSNNAFLAPHHHSQRQAMAMAAFVGAGRHCVAAGCEGQSQTGRLCGVVNGPLETAGELSAVVSVRSGGGALHISETNRWGTRHAGDDSTAEEGMAIIPGADGPPFASASSYSAKVHHTAIVANSATINSTGYPNGGILIALAALPLNATDSARSMLDDGKTTDEVEEDGHMISSTSLFFFSLQYAKHKHIVHIRGAAATGLSIVWANPPGPVAAGGSPPAIDAPPLAMCVFVADTTVYGKAVVALGVAAGARIAVSSGCRIGIGFPHAGQFLENSALLRLPSSLAILLHSCHRCVIDVGGRESSAHGGDTSRVPPPLFAARGLGVFGAEGDGSVLAGKHANLSASALRITGTTVAGGLELTSLALSRNATATITNSAIVSGDPSLHALAIEDSSAVLIAGFNAAGRSITVHRVSLRGTCGNTVRRVRVAVGDNCVGGGERDTVGGTISSDGRCRKQSHLEPCGETSRRGWPNSGVPVTDWCEPRDSETTSKTNGEYDEGNARKCMPIGALHSPAFAIVNCSAAAFLLLDINAARGAQVLVFGNAFGGGGAAGAAESDGMTPFEIISLRLTDAYFAIAGNEIHSAARYTRLGPRTCLSLSSAIISRSTLLIEANALRMTLPPPSEMHDVEPLLLVPLEMVALINSSLWLRGNLFEYIYPTTGAERGEKEIADLPPLHDAISIQIVPVSATGDHPAVWEEDGAAEAALGGAARLIFDANNRVYSPRGSVRIAIPGVGHCTDDGLMSRFSHRNPFAKVRSASTTCAADFGYPLMAQSPTNEREAAAHVAGGFSYFCACGASPRESLNEAVVAMAFGGGGAMVVGEGDVISIVDSVVAAVFIDVGRAVDSSIAIVNTTVTAAVYPTAGGYEDGSGGGVSFAPVSLRLSGSLHGNTNITIAGCAFEAAVVLNVTSPNCAPQSSLQTAPSSPSPRYCFITIAHNTFSDGANISSSSGADASAGPPPPPLLHIASSAFARGVHAAIVNNRMSLQLRPSGQGLVIEDLGGALSSTSDVSGAEGGGGGVPGVPMGGMGEGGGGAANGDGGAIAIIAFNAITAMPPRMGGGGAKRPLFAIASVGPMREFVVWGNTLGGGGGMAIRFTAEARRLIVAGNTASSFDDVVADPVASDTAAEGAQRHVGCNYANDPNNMANNGYVAFSRDEFGAAGVHECVHESTSSNIPVRIPLRCGWTDDDPSTASADRLMTPPLVEGPFPISAFFFCAAATERGVRATITSEDDADRMDFRRAVIGADAPAAKVPAAMFRTDDEHAGASVGGCKDNAGNKKCPIQQLDPSYGHYRQLLWETGGRGLATALPRSALVPAWCHDEVSSAKFATYNDVEHQCSADDGRFAGCPPASQMTPLLRQAPPKWVTAVASSTKKVVDSSDCAPLNVALLRAAPPPEPIAPQTETCENIPTESLSLRLSTSGSIPGRTASASQEKEGTASRSDTIRSSVTPSREKEEKAPTMRSETYTSVSTSAEEMNNETAATDLLPTNFTVRPIPNPNPPGVDTSRRITGTVSVVISVASVTSITGGQIGVANAMARMASCGRGEGGGRKKEGPPKNGAKNNATGDDGVGWEDDDEEEEVPILVHPLRFSVWDGQGNEEGMYFAAPISNMLLIPSAVAIASRFIMPRLLLCLGLHETEASALTTVGWPSVVAMPIITLAEGTGVSIVRSLSASGAAAPVGVPFGLMGLAALVVFIAAWARALFLVVPRRRVVLVRNDEWDGDVGGDPGQEATVRRRPFARRESSLTAAPRQLLLLFVRATCPTYMWAPSASEEAEGEGVAGTATEGREEGAASHSVEMIEMPLLDSPRDDEEQRTGGEGNPPPARSHHPAARGRTAEVTEDLIEQYGNALGDKRWYYAEIASFFCSLLVGAMEGVPDAHCRPRAVIAAIATILQCFFNCLSLIPLELGLELISAAAVAPMAIVVVARVFTDDGDGDPAPPGSGEATLEAATALLVAVANIVGLLLLALALFIGAREMLTRRRHLTRVRVSPAAKKRRDLLNTLKELNGDDGHASAVGIASPTTAAASEPLVMSVSISLLSELGSDQSDFGLDQLNINAEEGATRRSRTDENDRDELDDRLLLRLGASTAAPPPPATVTSADNDSTRHSVSVQALTAAGAKDKAPRKTTARRCLMSGSGNEDEEGEEMKSHSFRRTPHKQAQQHTIGGAKSGMADEAAIGELVSRLSGTQQWRQQPHAEGFTCTSASPPTVNLGGYGHASVPANTNDRLPPASAAWTVAFLDEIDAEVEAEVARRKALKGQAGS